MSDMAAQLAGRRVLVTGAAGGIGRVMCAVLAARGAQVCGLDRETDGLAQLAAQHSDLTTIVADLTNAAELARALATNQQAHGEFDCLVNNAAFIYDLGSLQKTTPASWQDEVNANLNGTFNVTHALLETLVGNAGRIVTVSSVNAVTSLGHPAYSAAKAGLVSFGKAIALEYGRYGVRSNLILPGSVATPAWSKRTAADPEIFAKLKQWYPLGRIVKPEEVATAACFLLSDDASAITGAVLNVDCGLLAGVLPFAEQLTLESMH